MVVEAATIVADGLDLFVKKVEEGIKKNSNTESGDQSDTQSQNLYNLANMLKDEDKYKMIKEVLVPADYNLIVTPKEIDDLIENMKDVIARRNKLLFIVNLNF